MSLPSPPKPVHGNTASLSTLLFLGTAPRCGGGGRGHRAGRHGSLHPGSHARVLWTEGKPGLTERRPCGRWEGLRARRLSEGILSPREDIGGHKPCLSRRPADGTATFQTAWGWWENVPVLCRKK